MATPYYLNQNDPYDTQLTDEWQQMVRRGADPAQINFLNAVRAQHDAGANPLAAQAQATRGVAWDPFTGAMSNAADAAAQHGMGFKGGMPTTSLADNPPQTSLTPQDLQAIAFNKSLAGMTDDARASMAAGDAVIGQNYRLADAMGQQAQADTDQQSIDHAFQAVDGGAQLSPDGHPVDSTGAPFSSAARQKILSALPGHLQLPVANLFMQQDAAATKNQLEKAQADEATAKAKQTANPPGMAPGDPGWDDAVTQAATTLAQTGRLPPNTRMTGANGAAFTAAVWAKSKALTDAAGTTLAGAGANYGANEGSLKAVQKSYDAAQSFLATADKNGDLLEQSIKQVPDLGSPVFNKPLRSFQQNVAGDPKMSQMATYLASVQNEYAKILSNPNMSGQLSDSARHEAQALIDPNATVPQMVQSLRALRTEGGNRLTSLNDQIKTIQQRIGSQSTAPAAGGGAVSVKAPNGKTYTFATPALADAFKQKAGIQ